MKRDVRFQSYEVQRWQGSRSSVFPNISSGIRECFAWAYREIAW